MFECVSAHSRRPLALVHETPTLPRGATLPEASWRRRHVSLLGLLAVHVVGVPAVALLHDETIAVAASEAVLLAVFVVAGARGPGGRTGRSLAVTLGLLAASALLVEGTGGLVQAHFHFFVVVTAVALYEDRRPLLLAIAFVFLWLGLSAALGRPFVDQPGSAWQWAVIHAGYVAAVSAINLVNWRAGEEVRREIAAGEQRHRALVEALERSNADLEQFASVASHDLSEPLRMVTSYLGLLRRRYRGQLGTDADLFIDHAVDGATRMRSLIDDLLAYARVGRGEEGRRAPVDLDASVAATLRSLEATIGDAGAEVQVDPLPEVAGDGPLLGQLFQNLIANALKFRGDRRPVVRVGARRDPAAWRFEVADNGIGIDPALSDRIFRMFQRGRAGEGYAGTGIGLAICRRIVERHGGRIWVEPTPGGGATFVFTIPDAPDRAREGSGRFGPRTREDVPAGIR